MYNVVVERDGVQSEVNFYFDIPEGTIIKDNRNRTYKVVKCYYVVYGWFDMDSFEVLIQEEFSPREIVSDETFAKEAELEEVDEVDWEL